MSHDITVRMLLTSRREEPLSAEEWRRVKARCAWVKETVAALREAHRRVDEAWDRMLDALPDDISDEELEALHLPDPPEQAQVDAIRAQLDAVIERDEWPKHLHWSL